MEAKRLFSRISLMFLHIFLVLAVMGQTTTPLIDLPKVVPPSPNAAALGKFGDIPVGEYTGIPNVSVPLYTVQVGKFQLPISLSYHSGGLKVEEVASSVGLGWALSAGGVITRSMHGAPDETSTGYLHQYGLHLDTIVQSHDLTRAACMGGVDLQPDMFYYNFAGQSGKFILDTTAEHGPRFMPFSNLKITHDANLDSFRVVDPNGIIYIFSATETTDVEGGRGSAQYISAWYLTTIITPSGNINFTYADETTSQIQRYELDYINAAIAANCVAPANQTAASTSVVDVKLLTQISSPFETVVFSTKVARQDMPSASSVTGMTVSDRNGALVKKYAFTQSYFGNPAATTSDKFRLKLDAVNEVSVLDSGDKKSYIFQYNNPTSVPSVYSYAKDFWGFYNGQNSNTTCLPYIDPVIYGDVIASRATTYGIRDPDAASSQVGMLKTIQYPTGGTSTFVYEGNDYSNAGDGTPVQNYTNYSVTAGLTDPLPTSVTSRTVGFYVPLRQTITFLIRGKHPATTEHDGYAPEVVLNKVNTDGSRTQIDFAYLISGTVTHYPQLDSGQYEIVATIDEGNTGEQAIGTVTYRGLDTSSTAHIALTGGVRIKQIINTDSITGNQQVKTYSYQIPDTTLSSGTLTQSIQVLTKKTAANAGVCDYYTRAFSPTNYLGSTQGSHVGYKVVTESEVSNNIYNGKKVSYYTSAWEIRNQKGINSFIVGESSNGTVAGTASVVYMTDNDVYRGLPVKELTYNQAGTLLKSEETNYNFTYPINANSTLNDYTVTALAGYTFYLCPVHCTDCNPAAGAGGSESPCSDYMEQNFQIAQYQVVCPWIYKTTLLSKLYDQNGLNPVVDTVKYYYDNPLHGQVTRQVVSNSRGDSLKTVSIYPQDKVEISGLNATASAVLDSMVNRNMIAPVVQVEKYNNNNLISRTRTDYSIWSGPRRNISPGKLWYQNGQGPLEERLDFLAYDGQDNPIQFAKVGDMNVSYIWDYLSEYPVAEVKNADSSSVAYTSFEADGAGNWTIGSILRNTTNGITGVRSYNLNSDITKSALNSAITYVVSYWTKRSAPFSIAGTVSGYPAKGKTINGWTLYVHKVTGQTTVSLSGSGLIDELRLYPDGAQMTTYTYTPLVGMTSQCDVGNRVTYYEYDGLQRMKRIRDQDYNIVKTYEYQYQASSGCGTNCYAIAMQTLAGSNTLGYPVGVFDVHGVLLGNATGPSQYVTLWNADTADSRIGTLSTGSDSLHFSLTLNSGMTLPAGVTGCRYYQIDLAWNRLDGVRNFNAAYVDFGDGTSMPLGAGLAGVPASVAANTTHSTSYQGYLDVFGSMRYYVHTYNDYSLKTLTFYHNDANEFADFDNIGGDATALSMLKNLRGNFPQNMPEIGGSSYQQASMTSVSGITNWSSLHHITNFRLNNGDGWHPNEHVSYPQDFLAGNPDLSYILTTWDYNAIGVYDSSFRLSRMKSDWNTYFTKIKYIRTVDNHWNREDLSALINLKEFYLYAAPASGMIYPISSWVSIPSTAIDNIINQIAAGAGQTISNGTISIFAPGSSAGSTSAASVSFLKLKGWTISINNNNL